MNISTHEFNPELTELHGRVFPDEIEADPFVVFHGTSGFNAASIEATGFYFPSSALSREKFERVSRIYEMIKWSGLHRGGYAVLKPFSMNHDFGEGAQSPIFFGDSSHQSLLYASRDFAGGEKLRALRISIGDLDDYLPILRFAKSIKRP